MAEIASPRVFTLAHVSDWHATSLLGAPARALATKRFWGWQSWHRSRRKRHLPEVLSCLLADVREQQPDHVVVTGDLTNVALEQEFVVKDLRILGGPIVFEIPTKTDHGRYAVLRKIERNLRVDRAGNISERLSGGGFHFARFGGACPRWNIHDVFRS